MKDSLFFQPWVGTRYQEGFNGRRILVVGACHICSLACPEKERCQNPATVREMDRECPCYKEMPDQEYYRLANSNRIEIQSFIDCEAHYPAYKIFTYYMLKEAGDLTTPQRESLWERLAFTNHLQHFHHRSDILPDDPAVYETAAEALEEVIDTLKPEIVMVWDSRVKECLKERAPYLAYLGMADMQFGLQLYLFLPKGNAVRGAALARVRYRYGIRSEKHRIGWYQRLLKKNLLNCIAGEASAGKTLNRLAHILMDMVDDGLLAASETSLYFPKTEKFRWTSLLKGLFLSALKDQFPDLGRGTNPAVERMFGEKIATNKRDSSLLKEEERRVARQLRLRFPASVGAGKTFSKNEPGF